jgi:hypothetical protein
MFLLFLLVTLSEGRLEPIELLGHFLEERHDKGKIEVKLMKGQRGEVDECRRRIEKSWEWGIAFRV